MSTSVRGSVSKGRVCDKHPDLFGIRYVSSSKCVGCQKEANAQWRIDNPDRVRALHKTWRDANPTKCREKVLRWLEAHPGMMASYSKARKARKRKAVPLWADKDKIHSLYILSKAYRNVGVDCEVDHIVPLKSSIVCGLHVEHNLQLLPRKINRYKSNIWCPNGI